MVASLPIDKYSMTVITGYLYAQRHTAVVTDTGVVRGPSVSIADLAKKRSKRRNIQLVKKVK